MTTKAQIKEFLRESNAIEGVFDDDSLSQALIAWMFLMKQKKLTTGVILRVHKILMLNQNLLPSDKGYFRKAMVYIGGRSALNALLIPEHIEHLVQNTEDAVTHGQKETEIWKERICREHHVEYERIHPFVDGNGRTGRMFYNWERLKLGLPLHIIHAGDEQVEYYSWFRDRQDNII